MSKDLKQLKKGGLKFLTQLKKGGSVMFAHSKFTFCRPPPPLEINNDRPLILAQSCFLNLIWRLHHFNLAYCRSSQSDAMLTPDCIQTVENVSKGIQQCFVAQQNIQQQPFGRDQHLQHTNSLSSKAFIFAQSWHYTEQNSG